MSKREIRVALVGAGMAGRAHAYGYRNIESMFSPFPATVRLVAVTDAYEPLARQTAERFGFERVEPSWQAIAQSTLPQQERLGPSAREELLTVLFGLWKFGSNYGGMGKMELRR